MGQVLKGSGDSRQLRTDYSTFEKSYHGIGARSAVQPQGQRRVRWVVPRFKEPEKHVGLVVEINISGVRIDTRSRFTDTFLAWFLVPDSGSSR